MKDNEDVSVGEVINRTQLYKQKEGQKFEEKKEFRSEERQAERKAQEMTVETEKSLQAVSNIREYLKEYYKKLDEIMPPSDDLQAAIRSSAQYAGSKIPIAGTLISPKVKAFDSFRKASRVKIARGLGDVGNLTEQEQKVAQDLLAPIISSTEERSEAQKLFEDILLSAQEGAIETIRQQKIQRAKDFLNRIGTRDFIVPEQQKQTGKKIETLQLFLSNNPNIPMEIKQKAIRARNKGFSDVDVINGIKNQIKVK